MKKNIVTIFIFTALAMFSVEAVFADGFIICKAPGSSMASKAGCIKVYNTDGKACSDQQGKTCSSESLEDLCIKTGKKIGLPYNSYASGQGNFKTESACMQQCDKQYGGKFKRFGGECFTKVAK